MLLIKEIEEKYNYGDPILLKEIINSSLHKKKDSTIRKQVSRLVEKKKLVLVDRGIYTLPEKSLTGKYKKPELELIFDKKYIKAKGKDTGYYTGLTLLNNLGISFQIPNIKEIVTNNEKSRKRIVTIMNRKVILRKPRVNINAQNLHTLQFLDAITIFDKFIDIKKVDALSNIIKYFKKKNVTIKDIEKYINFYPAVTSKKIMEYRIYNEFT